jgi:hypothetical protein
MHMKDMYLKIHGTPQGKIVAACDRELLGTVLEDGRACLDLRAYRGFYEGELASADELAQALASSASANLVGKRAVAAALASGLARQSDVIYIKKTPHIQIYRL